MRELNLNEIHCVSGGEWTYPWWSVPLFAAGGAGVSNAWAMYTMHKDYSRSFANGIHFAIPAAITSAIIMVTYEAVSKLASFTFSLFPAPQGNGALCHG